MSGKRDGIAAQQDMVFPAIIESPPWVSTAEDATYIFATLYPATDA
ncbi:hypothetical protein [Candidatus Palauibacter sp.]